MHTYGNVWEDGSNNLLVCKKKYFLIRVKKIQPERKVHVLQAFIAIVSEKYIHRQENMRLCENNLYIKLLFLLLIKMKDEPKLIYDLCSNSFLVFLKHFIPIYYFFTLFLGQCHSNANKN